VPSPTPYGLPFPKIGASKPHPKTAITIVSGTAKATDCKFGRYILQGPSEHKPMKNFAEKGAWTYPGKAQFFLSTPYYLRNG